MYYLFPQSNTPAYRAIVRLPSFERSAKALLSDEAERWLDNVLGERPDVGVVIPGTGGVRKLRMPLPGGGKSGGVRVIYILPTYSGADFSASGVPEKRKRKPHRR